MIGIVIALVVTMYAPSGGGINGNPKGRYANGQRVSPDDDMKVAACSYNYKLGEVVRVGNINVTCVDRGRLGRNHIDIFHMTTRKEIVKCGKRRIHIDVCDALRFGRREVTNSGAKDI